MLCNEDSKKKKRKGDQKNDQKVLGFNILLKQMDSSRESKDLKRYRERMKKKQFYYRMNYFIIDSDFVRKNLMAIIFPLLNIIALFLK